MYMQWSQSLKRITTKRNLRHHQIARVLCSNVWTVFWTSINPHLYLNTNLQRAMQQDGLLFLRENPHYIHEGLESICKYSDVRDQDAGCKQPSNYLTDISPVMEEDVGKTIRQSPSKSCYYSILFPIITRIIRLSLSSSTVPTSFKIAAVAPILNKFKCSHTQELPCYFQLIFPIQGPWKSGSKTTSLTQGYQWSSWDNVVHLPTAPFYWDCHPLRAKWSPMRSLDQKILVAMVVIDLSAAFDAVNHSILLHLLSKHYGIKRNTHAWLKSYLTDRRQFITIKGERSEEEGKCCDATQGSALGPNL